MSNYMKYFKILQIAAILMSTEVSIIQEAVSAVGYDT